MELRRGDVPQRRDLVRLYEAVGWSAYIRDPDALERAVRGSQELVTAWLAGDLVGLARAVTDGVSILYLQDVLVAPDHRRSGIGRALVEAALEPYADVRQKVLLADDDPVSDAFHRSLGYVPAADVDGGPLVAYVRLDG